MKSPDSALNPERYPILARLRARLEAIRRRRISVVAARAVIEAVCAQLFLLPLAGLLAAFNPYDTLGLKLALATYAVYLWPLFRLEAARRRGAFGIQVVAADCDRLNPDAPDIFRTVLSWRSHSTQTLAALNTFYGSWESRLIDPKLPVLTRARRWSLLVALGFAVGAPFLSPHPRAVFYRMALPLRAWSAIPAPRLIPLDIPEQVLRGDSVTVRLRLEHVPGSRAVYAHCVLPEGETRYLLFRATSGDTARVTFARFAWGPAAQDFALRFSTAGFTTRLYQVRVAERPRLSTLEVTLTPPSYTGLPAERLSDMPALVSVLPGTEATWKARAAMPLQKLSAEFRTLSPASTTGPKVQGKGEVFSFRHVLKSAGELRLGLTDEHGASGTEGPFRIELKIDAPPEITLLAPSGNSDLGRTLKLPVLFRAHDDYGISRIVLRYGVRREGQPAQSAGFVPVGVDVTAWLNRREGGGGGIWDASSLRLEAGDAVEMWLEATDNDAVSGPKTVASAHVQLRVPSRDEVRAAVAEGEHEASVSLTSALEREKRLQRESTRPTQGAATEAAVQSPPMAVPESEIQRVLSDQPRQHLGDLKRELDTEIKLAEKNLPNVESPPRREAERALRALQELRREAQAQEQRLPPPDIGRASPEQQKKSLEALNADQKALEKKLQQTPPEATLAQNRKQLEEALKRNLQDQKDMKDWMGERERNAATEQKRTDQASQNAGQMQQDMKKAMEQIDKAMEKGLENGTLSPEMLEKMERIRELLEEVLDPDEKESLRQAQKNDRVEAGDLQRAMHDLLDKKDGLRQSLESAIKMLEALRETRALRDAAAQVRDVSEQQRQLANEMAESANQAGKAPSAAELAESQQELNKQMDAAMKSLENLARSPSMKDALKDMDKQTPREARANMQKAADKLKAPSPDRKAAKQGADLASKQLKQMASELEKKVAKMDQASNAAEVRATLEETLDFSGWLESAGDPDAEVAAEKTNGWGGEEGVRQGSVRITRWLCGRMDKIADDAPFASDVLRREAAAMGFEADVLSAPSASSASSSSILMNSLASLRAHAQRAARELFKMLDKDQDSGGSDEGDGEGDSDAGGGASGSSGKEGLSGRMKGAAGKQSAVNRATQELLRSFLQGREGNSQSQGGQGEGQGQGGQSPGGESPRSSAQGSPRNGQGSGVGSQEGQQGGETPGSQGEGGTEGDGKTPRSSNDLANTQQQVGESLEQLAESAGDAGGAARKLRQLAEEARELEEALRRRALSPDEIQRRQERFQTRLLEAANALEERGNQRERRAEAYKGGALPPVEAGGASSDEALIRELKRRRDEARKLPLPPEQKRRVEWYYEQLLAP